MIRMRHHLNYAMRNTLIICIFLFSCSKQTLFFDDEFQIKENIQLNALENFPSDSLLLPNHMCSFNDYIILEEDKLNLLLSSYNMSTGEFKRFQKKGRGPEELLNIQQITGTPNDNEFCVWALYGNKAFIYSINDDQIIVQSSLPVKSDYVTFNITSDYIIGSQAGKQKRFLVQNLRDSSVFEFGEPIAIDKNSPEIVSSFLLGPCLYNSDLKRFAWFATFGNVLEIYSYDSIPQLLCQKIGILPIIDHKSEHPGLSAKTRLGVLSATATDKYILGLYSTHFIEEFSLSNDKMHWVDKILVYDWDGKPVKMLLLDRPVKTICFNKEKNRVYCIGATDEGNNIFYFDVDVI